MSRISGGETVARALHGDAKREYAYGPARALPGTKVGTFTQALYDQATKQGWVVISMKGDWKGVFLRSSSAANSCTTGLSPRTAGGEATPPAIAQWKR